MVMFRGHVSRSCGDLVDPVGLGVQGERVGLVFPVRNGSLRNQFIYFLPCCTVFFSHV